MLPFFYNIFFFQFPYFQDLNFFFICPKACPFFICLYLIKHKHSLYRKLDHIFFIVPWIFRSYFLTAFSKALYYNGIGCIKDKARINGWKMSPYFFFGTLNYFSVFFYPFNHEHFYLWFCLLTMFRSSDVLDKIKCVRKTLLYGGIVCCRNVWSGLDLIIKKEVNNVITIEMFKLLLNFTHRVY